MLPYKLLSLKFPLYIAPNLVIVIPYPVGKLLAILPSYLEPLA